MAKIGISLELGPLGQALVDGSLEQDLDEALSDAEQTVARAVRDGWAKNLHASLRNPTGRYEGSVQMTRTLHQVDVNDGGMVYGPWLEGTSSRNASTLFKGYTALRRAQQAAEQQVAEDTERALARVLGEYR